MFFAILIVASNVLVEQRTHYTERCPYKVTDLNFIVTGNRKGGKKRSVMIGWWESEVMEE